MRRVVQTWWPLAASWLFMAVEGPMVSAVVARLLDPKIHLAAWGGIVWPLLLLIESPIIMLLSASTALSKDWDSYRRLRRFMMSAGAILTVVHVLIAYTPFYYVVAGEWIGAPKEIIEPGRVGMMIMIPWTWAIGYRRFNQGVLIRFGHSRAVGLGTLIRISADALVLIAGYMIGTLPGIVVASITIAVGVVSEAIYAGFRVRPVLRRELRLSAPVEEPLTVRSFLAFYTPLAMTALLNMLVQPLISAALSRMPRALDSLAAWSLVAGFVFLLRSLSYAYNEVVIALLDRPQAVRNLRRFASLLAISTPAFLLIIVATPLATLWFGRISALAPPLVAIARTALWIALPIPGLDAMQSWYRGTIVHSRRTRGISEAIAVFLLTIGTILWVGVARGQMTGLYVGMGAYSAGMLAQMAWLWWRSRPAMRAVETHDAALSTV
jgi:hypothetical protein